MNKRNLVIKTTKNSRIVRGSDQSMTTDFLFDLPTPADRRSLFVLQDVLKVLLDGNTAGCGLFGRILF